MMANAAELGTLRECGSRLAAVLRAVAAAVRPGVPTAELDALAERLIAAAGGAPGVRGYRAEPRGRPFPAVLCVSINDEVVHGIPRPERIVRSGDLVGLDIGMRWPASADPAESGTAGKPAGLITDMAVTVAVGEVSPPAKKLLAATRAALERGIGVLRAGLHLGDLGYAIQQAIESQGFSVVRDLVGHGVGRTLHEDPYVPNYGRPGEGMLLTPGMTLAIEPMATLGSPAVELDPDGWTWRTADGSLAAHFEHTIVVTEQGAEILTR